MTKIYFLLMFVLVSNISLKAQSNGSITAMQRSQSDQQAGSLIIFEKGNLTQKDLATDILNRNYSTDWERHASYEQVDIFTRYSDCSDPANGFFPEKILFKVANKTNQRIYVYWDYEIAFDDKPTAPSENENLVQIVLEPGQTLEGTCGNLHQTKLGVFVRYIGQQPVLSSLILSNIHIFNLN